MQLVGQAHSVTHLRSEWSEQKFSSTIIIIPSERYVPQNWLCRGTLARSLWHSKLKTNQTDIALNTLFIFSPYLGMFTSSRWLTEVGRGDVSHFGSRRLFSSERSLFSDSLVAKLAVFSVLHWSEGTVSSIFVLMLDSCCQSTQVFFF